MTLYHCECAWLGGPEVASDVLIEASGDRITRITTDVDTPPPGARHLSGLTMPGLVNTHSHAFHRAIRGHSQSGVADFWQWRSLMYGVAERLNPDLLFRLARATYAEMVLSGITTVAEFHYVHHRAAGKTYADPNELGRALAAAAREAGLRLTLLDTCYLQAGVDGSPLEGVQKRFDDGSWATWAERVALMDDAADLRIGAAIHSVRAVPRAALRGIAKFARDGGRPLHVHLSEQPAENQACLEAFGVTPTALLATEGVLGPGTTAIHATHLTDQDIQLLGASGTAISMCCTTERDLADGVGPAHRLSSAGSPICVASDAHMVIDLWEEARAVELDERLVSGKRGHFTAEQLADALTRDGAEAAGWSDAGRIETGALADLVTVRLDSPHTAGARFGDTLAAVVFTATGADVTDVVVGGREVVREGRHASLEVGTALESAIAAALDVPLVAATRRSVRGVVGM